MWLTVFTITILVISIMVAIRLRPGSIWDGVQVYSGHITVIVLVSLTIAVFGIRYYYYLRSQTAQNWSPFFQEIKGSVDTNAQSGGGGAPNTGGAGHYNGGSYWAEGELVIPPAGAQGLFQVMPGTIPEANGGWDIPAQPAPTSAPGVAPTVTPTPVPQLSPDDLATLDNYYMLLNKAYETGDINGGQAVIVQIRAIDPRNAVALQAEMEIAHAVERTAARQTINEYGEGQTEIVTELLGAGRYRIDSVTSWQWSASNPFYFPKKWDETSVVTDITPGWTYGQKIAIRRGHVNILNANNPEKVGDVFIIAN